MKDVVAHDQCRQAVGKSVNASRMIGRRQGIWPDNVEPGVHLRDRQSMKGGARQSQRRQIIRMRYLQDDQNGIRLVSCKERG